MNATLNRSRLRVAGALAALGGIALVGVLLAADPGTAADPFQAGQVSTRQTTLPDQAQAAIAARADRDLHDLGLRRGVRRSIQRLEDRFEGTTYDEVTEIDAADQPVSMLRYGTDGSLKAAIALGWSEGKGRPVSDRPAVANRARAFARLVGAPGGEPTVEPLADGSGWGVAWPRAVDGIPVPGDGVRVGLWQDGTLHRLVRSERPLAPRPAVVLDEAAAKSVADGLLRSWYASRRDELVIEAAPLAWIAPNDAFEPSKPDAPASTLSLARVVAVRATGSLADQLQRLEIYVDAGDGHLLGGDVLE